jgi:enolase
MAKWNEGIRIEEALGSAARFAGRSAVGGAPRRVAAE